MKGLWGVGGQKIKQEVKRNPRGNKKCKIITMSFESVEEQATAAGEVPET